MDAAEFERLRSVTSGAGHRAHLYPVHRCASCGLDTPHGPVGCLVCDLRVRAALLPADADTIGAPF